MKYAKKFKLVPYSAETPASTQINAALTNSLKMPTIPEQKVKIYNTALTKLKELQEENQIKPVLNTNYEIEQNDEDISKEISDLEKQTIQNKASENIKDYSKSNNLNEIKFKRKEKFDNNKFLNLLEDIAVNNYNTNAYLLSIQNLLNKNQNSDNSTPHPNIDEWDLSRKSVPTLNSALTSLKDTNTRKKIFNNSLLNRAYADNTETPLPPPNFYKKNNLSRSIIKSYNNPSPQTLFKTPNKKLFSINERSLDKSKNASTARRLSSISEISADKSQDNTKNDEVFSIAELFPDNNITMNEQIPSDNELTPNISQNIPKNLNPKVLIEDISKNPKYIQFYTQAKTNLDNKIIERLKQKRLKEQSTSEIISEKLKRVKKQPSKGIRKKVKRLNEQSTAVNILKNIKRQPITQELGKRTRKPTSSFAAERNASFTRKRNKKAE